LPKIKIDDLEYNTEDLTDQGKVVLASLQFVDQKLRNYRNEIAVYQTAQTSYLEALKSEISDSGIEPIEVEPERTDEKN